MSPRRLALVAFCGLLAAAAVALGAGELLSRPAPRTVGAPPADFPARRVQFGDPPGPSVAGWFMAGQPGQGVVLLLHGVRADRTQMLARARFLHRAGYASLLVDLPAHGESAGERITFGAREALGVQAALAYLRRTLPAERVGVIGVSLGAASLVLAQPVPAPDAVVLESMYPTIGEAVANRLAMRLGPLGARLAPVLLWQLPLRAGVGARELRPIDGLARLAAPVLIAAGTADRHTPWPETRRLFDAAGQPKELWPVDGAAHGDLHAFAPQAYEARTLRFLATHLRGRD